MDNLTLKKEVAAVIQDVPNHTLPLFKFREMFEKRYRRSVSSSDLYRMKDVVRITDNSRNDFGIVSGGRTITLSMDWDQKGDEGIEVFCLLHPPMKSGLKSNSNRLGWAEKEVGISLPNVEIKLGILTQRIGNMLDLHPNGFPLFSFLDCYGGSFGYLEEKDDGVPLEHLISCIQGIEISYAENGVKKVGWKIRREHESSVFYNRLSTQLAQLSRELVDLLKTFPRCSIPFSKLIPAYHHHFGRQCRVSDYGHLSLSSLLQNLPMTVQVIGEGSTRIVILAHRAQMKRFSSDVLRVLKAQPGVKKQINIDDFPSVFSQIFPNRVFNPEDYGLCYFTDLVTELVENFPMVTLLLNEDGKEMLAIPKKEQSLLEIQKTKIFSAEVVELLSHSIRCEMPFSKFIPSYHHHFGKQCRLSDYGFGKLVELFDAVPEIVKSESPFPGIDCNPEDKILRLTPKEQIKVVGDQIYKLVEERLENGILTHVNELEDRYLSQYGFALRPDFCGAVDVRDLLNGCLKPWITLDGDYLKPNEIKINKNTEFPSSSDSDVKMEGSEELLDLQEVEKEFQKFGFGVDDSEKIGKKLKVFAQEMLELLECFNGCIHIQNIEIAYAQKFGRQIIPSELGCPSLMSLLQGIPEVGSLRGKFRTKRVFVQNKNLNNGNGGIRNRESGSNYSNNHNQGFHGKYSQHKIINNNNGNNYGGGGSQEQVSWNPLTHAHVCQTIPTPSIFSPILPSPSYRQRDTNIFNFDQTPQMSPPMYDMWMTAENGSQGSPPLSPHILWAYHPICYPPNSPGSPNLLIPSFSYGPWNSQHQNQPIMNPPCFEMEQHQQQIHHQHPHQPQ